MRLFRRFLLLVLFPAFASASLQFESTRIDLKPAVRTKSITVVFPFKNTGTTPVYVLEVSSSCGCTVPELNQKSYAPGEAGVLNVRFEIGDRQGLQSKSIHVRTDAGEQELQLVVDLPQRLVIEPRLIIFRPDGVTERTLTLAFRADGPVSQVTLTNPSPTFVVTLATDHVGSDYTVTVKLSGSPTDDQHATVFVRSKGASGLDYTDAFYLRYAPDQAAP